VILPVAITPGVFAPALPEVNGRMARLRVDFAGIFEFDGAESGYDSGRDCGAGGVGATLTGL